MASVDAGRVRRRVIVTGRVQGVFFRGSTQEHARRRGVDGWVRNRADGSVEAAFEGHLPAVEHMLAWCRTGPDWARVEHLEVFEEAPQDETGFEVR
jgi:acylphosphatase